MTLTEAILTDTKQALKSNQQDKLEALRLLSSEIKNIEIKKKPKPLQDSDILAVIKKQVKQYKEVAQELVQARRTSEAEVELTKMEYLKKYLPPELSEEELVRIVNETILSIKAMGLQDQGLVIKEVQKKVKGRVDNLLIAQVVRNKLQEL